MDDVTGVQPVAIKAAYKRRAVHLGGLVAIVTIRYSRVSRKVTVPS